jgi:hypothetical protein
MHNVYFKRMPTGKCKNFLQAIYILPATRKCKKQGKKCHHWTTVPCPNVVNRIHSFGRALFVWLISHQSGVLFSQNKSATSHQQSASSTFLSEQISTSHQPPAKRTGWNIQPSELSVVSHMYPVPFPRCTAVGAQDESSLVCASPRRRGCCRSARRRRSSGQGMPK